MQNYNHKYTSGSALEPLPSSSTLLLFRSLSPSPLSEAGAKEMQINIFADKDHKLPGFDDFLNKRMLPYFPGDSSEILLQSMGKILSAATGTQLLV